MRRSRFRLVFVSVFALAVSLGVISAANAEHPGWALPGTPKIVGGPAQVGATLTGDHGPIYCQPECTRSEGEWLSCTGPSSGGADRPPGAHNDPNQRAPGCEARTPLPGPGTYVIRAEDQGRYIQFHVVAHNLDCGEVRSDGTQECNPSQGHGHSPTVGPIAPGAPPPPAAPKVALPVNTARPTISGAAEDMQMLSVNPGTWTGSPAFGYQWEHCSTALKGCEAIEGAVARTYKIGRADIGARIQVAVTARNEGGSFTFRTKLTERVAAARPRPGQDVLKVEALLPAHRLVVKDVNAPRIIQSKGRFWLRVTITDRRGFLIHGAIVEASAKPGATAPVSKTTGRNGVALLLMTLNSPDAASRVTVQVKASKSNEDALTTTKLVVLRTRG